MPLTADATSGMCISHMCISHMCILRSCAYRYQQARHELILKLMGSFSLDIRLSSRPSVLAEYCSPYQKVTLQFYRSVQTVSQTFRSAYTTIPVHLAYPILHNSLHVNFNYAHKSVKHTGPRKSPRLCT